MCPSIIYHTAIVHSDVILKLWVNQLFVFDYVKRKLREKIFSTFHFHFSQKKFIEYNNIVNGNYDRRVVQSYNSEHNILRAITSTRTRRRQPEREEDSK